MVSFNRQRWVYKNSCTPSRETRLLFSLEKIIELLLEMWLLGMREISNNVGLPVVKIITIIIIIIGLSTYIAGL